MLLAVLCDTSTMQRPNSRSWAAWILVWIALMVEVQCSPADYQVVGQVIANVTLPDDLNADSSSHASNVHEVVVGKDAKAAFSPSHVQAGIGDIVRFKFTSGNHSVTESTFAEPCRDRNTFDTGFIRVGANNTTRSISLLVDSTVPRWFYCRHSIPVGHCQIGMVFAINPGELWKNFLVQASARSTALLTDYQATSSPLCTESIASYSHYGVESGLDPLYGIEPQISSSLQDAAQTNSEQASNGVTSGTTTASRSAYDTGGLHISDLAHEVSSRASDLLHYGTSEERKSDSVTTSTTTSTSTTITKTTRTAYLSTQYVTTTLPPSVSVLEYVSTLLQ